MNQTPSRSAEVSSLSAFAKKYGPWAVITGASDGIGRELARECARLGLKVVLVARRKSVLNQFGAELNQQFRVETKSIAADLGQPEGVHMVVEETAGIECGLLIASAGFGTSGNFIEGELPEELNMIDVNCRSVAHLVHAFGNRFATQKRGGIILLSSLVGFQGVPRAANYAATKAYVQSLAEGIRHELKSHNVDVLASAPGPVNSGFAQRASMTMGMAQTPREVAVGTIRALGRTGTVRPGFLAKLLAWSLATLPRWGRVRIMKIVMGGMTKG
jgi:uncharacterized protein